MIKEEARPINMMKIGAKNLFKNSSIIAGEILLLQPRKKHKFYGFLRCLHLYCPQSLII